MSHIHTNMRVFDVVEFQRWNEHRKPPAYENFVCIWMHSPDGGVFQVFQRIDRQFASAVLAGEREFFLSATVAEEREAEPHDTPPKGYSELPARTKLVRPSIGGYDEHKRQQKREAKKAARIAKLRG